MILRHAEKPGQFGGQEYSGVDSIGRNCGDSGAEDLVTIGWQRSGALVTLFAPPWGPKSPTLDTPKFLFAANPAKVTGQESSGTQDADAKVPSQRPYETLTALAGVLGTLDHPMEIDTSFSKKHYREMVAAALACAGPVLICWQHEDIPLVTDEGKAGISQCILTQTNTPDGRFNIPESWPAGAHGARYDLVWVFDRDGGSGPITGFTLFAQFLLAGDTIVPLTTQTTSDD
jgi:hypothetical protein